jgi:hypothetical protein
VIPILPVCDLEEARELWSRAGLEAGVHDEGWAFVLESGEERVHLAVHRAVDPEPDVSARSARNRGA